MFPRTNKINSCQMLSIIIQSAQRASFALTLIYFVSGSYASNQNPPADCVKEIKCVAQTQFMFCPQSEYYASYGPKLLTCQPQSPCDENNPSNGCVAELIDQGGEVIDIYLNIGDSLENIRNVSVETQGNQVNIALDLDQTGGCATPIPNPAPIPPTPATASPNPATAAPTPATAAPTPATAAPNPATNITCPPGYVPYEASSSKPIVVRNTINQDIQDGCVELAPSATTPSNTAARILASPNNNSVHVILYKRHNNSERTPIYETNVNLKENSIGDILPDLDFDEIVFEVSQMQELSRFHLGAIQPENSFKLTIKPRSISELQPGLFNNIKNLREFTAAYNRLTQISTGVFNNQPFQTVNLQNNYISFIFSTAFDNMTNLVKLNLKNNNLKLYDQNWFKNTPNLNTLYLSYNQIEYLPGMVFKNLNLQLPLSIYLYHNRIRMLDDNVFISRHEDFFNSMYFQKINLLRLGLGSNRLQCVTRDLKRSLVAKIVTLRRNPLSCECIERIVRWMHDSHSTRQVLYTPNKYCQT